jgi:hypothetical protein
MLFKHNNHPSIKRTERCQAGWRGESHGRQRNAARHIRAPLRTCMDNIEMGLQWSVEQPCGRVMMMMMM